MSADKKPDDYNELLLIAKSFLMLVSKDLDQYTDEKGIVQMMPNKVVLFTTSHIQFAKYGRGPGKNPPFKNILDFVKKERIKFKGKDDNGTAAAIQFSIGKNGTKNYVKNAPNALEETLDKYYAEYNEDIRKYLNVSIEDQLVEITKDIPIEKEFKI